MTRVLKFHVKNFFYLKQASLSFKYHAVKRQNIAIIRRNTVLAHSPNLFPSITIALGCISWVYLWFNIEHCNTYIIYILLSVLFTFSHFHNWINMQTDVTCNSMTDWIKVHNSYSGRVSAHNLKIGRLAAYNL